MLQERVVRCGMIKQTPAKFRPGWSERKRAMQPRNDDMIEEAMAEGGRPV